MSMAGYMEVRPSIGDKIVVIDAWTATEHHGTVAYCAGDHFGYIADEDKDVFVCGYEDDWLYLTELKK